MQKNLITYFDEYKDHCKYTLKRRPETIIGYEAAFKLLLQLVPELSLTSDLTPSTMDLFFKRLNTRERIIGKGVKKVGVKASTVKTYHSKLETFFNWMVVREYIKSNPLNEIPAPEVVYDDQRALTEEDFKKLLASVVIYSGSVLIKKRDTLMLMMLRYLGLRKTEMLLLEVGDISSDISVLTVRGVTSKSRRTRRIPISTELKFHIKEYLSERKIQGYKTPLLLVSANKDSGLTHHGLKHWVKKLERNAEVDFHVHQLRHSFACSLARRDVHVEKIRRLMGHTDLRMTQSYLRSLGVEDLRNDIEKII